MVSLQGVLGLGKEPDLWSATVIQMQEWMPPLVTVYAILDFLGTESGFVTRHVTLDGLR